MNRRWQDILWPEGAIWAALLLLLGASFGVAYWPAAPGLLYNLAFAAVMAVGTGLFYMHLDRASGLVRLTAVLGVLWLAVLFVLTFADFLTR